MPAYDTALFNPPAPVALVNLRKPQSDAIAHGVPMLLDSGADVSLIPRMAAEQVGATALSGKQYELVGFEGSSTVAPVVQLELLLFGKTFRGQFLLLDEEWGILGRNILNALPILLDGPNLSWNEFRPR